MRGMDTRSGKPLDANAHLSQSIADILTTPIGSRIERRDYGSLLPELIDQPFNDKTRLQLYGATATALMRWEPRIRVTRIAISRPAANGAFVLDLTCQLASAFGTGTPTGLTVPIRFRNP